MKANKYAALFLALSLLFLTACGHIEDTNGSDTSLCSITRAQLSGKTISSTQSGVSTKTERNRVTINTQHEQIDVDYLEMSGGKLSGVVNIMATELRAGDSLTVACESAVQAGNLAVVLLAPDGTILHEFATGAYEEAAVAAPQDGVYLLRIGAESFTGAILAARDF